MQSVSLKSDQGWKKEEQFIDPQVHTCFSEGVSFSSQPIYGEEAQKKSILNPREQPGLHFSILEFQQAPHYKYFYYDQSQPEMIDYKSCVICGSEMISVSSITNQKGKDFLTLGLCLSCGFFQHTRRPQKSWYADFYRKMWDPETRKIEFPDTVNLRQEPVNRLSGYARLGQRVLEIGSGWGSCLKTFQQYGLKPYGIEATEHRSQFIRERLGIPCFTGEAEDLPIGVGDFQPESFDILFSTNVLEHVYNTRQVLEHTYKLLKPNGLGYFEVPIYYQENLTLNTHGVAHTCNFTLPNFVYLLQTIGYDVIHDFSSVDMVRVLARKSFPITESQKQSRLEWMSHILPYRGLAYLIEKNGFSTIPQNLNEDLLYEFDWKMSVGDMKNTTFLKMKTMMLKQFAEPIDQIRKVIRKRKPIELIQHFLPIRYVYASENVPIWYY